MHPSYQDDEWKKSPPPSAPPANYYGYADQAAPPPATGIPISTPTVPAPAPPLASQFQTTSSTPAGYWSTGLCYCFSDCSNCCITCWCPCITFGQIAEIVDKGSTSCAASGALYALLTYLTGCSCIYSCFYRSKMRQQYMLPESPCADCLVHCCCEPCALCQEYRELKTRGFDMSLGWHGNMERQNQGVAKAPLAQQGMNR